MDTDETRAGTAFSEQDAGTDVLQFYLRPNRSLSAQTLWVLWIAYAALALTIGAGFVWLGAWPVLPFAGLELAFVSGVLWYLNRHAEDSEILILDEREVRVIRREGRRTHERRFPRYWARARLVGAEQDWYPTRLLIGSHGQFVEICAGVGEAERRTLYRRLRRLLGGGAI